MDGGGSRSGVPRNTVWTGEDLFGREWTQITIKINLIEVSGENALALVRARLAVAAPGVREVTFGGRCFASASSSLSHPWVFSVTHPPICSRRTVICIRAREQGRACSGESGRADF